MQWYGVSLLFAPIIFGVVGWVGFTLEGWKSTNHGSKASLIIEGFKIGAGVAAVFLVLILAALALGALFGNYDWCYE